MGDCGVGSLLAWHLCPQLCVSLPEPFTPPTPGAAGLNDSPCLAPTHSLRTPTRSHTEAGREPGNTVKYILPPAELVTGSVQIATLRKCHATDPMATAAARQAGGVQMWPSISLEEMTEPSLLRGSSSPVIAIVCCSKQGLLTSSSTAVCSDTLALFYP